MVITFPAVGHNQNGPFPIFLPPIKDIIAGNRVSVAGAISDNGCGVSALSEEEEAEAWLPCEETNQGRKTDFSQKAVEGTEIVDPLKLSK